MRIALKIKIDVPLGNEQDEVLKCKTNNWNKGERDSL